MSMTFTKLFTSITESTIWAEPDHTRLVWITMLAMADHAGRVWGSIPGLANRARVPLEKCEEALQSLMSPDKYSRTKDHEGRRIEEIDGGWRLLNHAKYRAIRDEESIKESKRRYINERRAKERSTVEQSRSESNDVDRSRPNADAYTEAEAETESYSEPSRPGVPPAPPLATLACADTAAPAAARKPRKQKEPAKTAETWGAYAQAYRERYGVDPVRNRTINAQLAQLVERLGAEEAPGVARFYVGHRNGYYVQRKHSVGAMLADAEKLRTEWVTGQTTYQRDAREEDRIASTGAMWDRVAKNLGVKDE